MRVSIESVWDRKWWSAPMELIFPSRCPVCDGLLEWTESLIGNGRGVHSQCQERLKPVRTPFCHHCGKTVLSEQQEYCEDCLKKSAFYFRQGRALFVYEREMKTSMYRYKYQNRRCYAKFFTQRAVQNYRDWIERICPDVIVPVPMFAKKKRKRGYNQAEVFAKELSKVLHIPCRTNLIQRVRNTRPMKELDDEKREKNLQNAFQIHQFVVQYKKVLLVDDIYTTGITEDVISALLQKAGVSEVYVLNICIVAK